MSFPQKSGPEKAPESAAAKAQDILDPKKLTEIEGVSDIMEHLKKGDWGAMVGAIMTLYKEYFGTPEEKAEVKRAREAAKKEQEAKDTGKKKRDDLKADVEAKRGDKDKSEENKDEASAETVQLRDNPKLGDGSDLVLIGDSIPKGMRNKVHGWSVSPLAIAERNLSTGKVLELLRGKQALLKGKKRAVIQCGANNIGGNPKTLVQHIVDMAKICHKHKVQEIIVASQFPADPRRGNKKKIIAANAAFRDELIAAKKRGDFPSSVRIADLTSAFGNEKGEMMEKFVDRKVNDPSHPRSAYGAALDYILRGSKTKKS